MTNLTLADHAGIALAHGKPRVNGVEIHYAIGGTGEPVFPLRGVPKTMTYWRHVVPLLTPHLARDVAELATSLGCNEFRVADEDSAGSPAARTSGRRPRPFASARRRPHRLALQLPLPAEPARSCC